MEKSQMKNMVILKNLPSNLIDEAILIIKPNKYARKIQYIDKKDIIKSKDKQTKDNNYIIREAESVISNYINSVENKDKQKQDTYLTKKYKKLKIYSILITIVLFIVLLVL